MVKKIFLKFETNTYLSLVLLSFSFLINYIYASNGVFPIDTFLHYDSSYRITQGEYPIKDFWVVSGILVDFLGALFFEVFGINWNTYILHSSLINCLITISTYIFFLKIKLKSIYAFIYSIFVSILAYPPSGTPFVDHHSVFLSLIAGYLLIIAIISKKNVYWFLFPIFLALSFLSKQVPSSYLIILFALISVSYCYTKGEYRPIIYSFTSSLFIIVTLFIFLKICGIEFQNFLNQYVFYPQSIGLSRIEILNLNFISFLNSYKFLIILFLILLILNFHFFFKKSTFNKDDFFTFLIVTCIFFSLLFHQLLTKNQIFIYFLIPILVGFLQSILDKKKFKINKKIAIYILIFFTIFTTVKYHLRYNESRKFHDLHNVNLNNAISAKMLDSSFKGLRWITNDFKDNPRNEINSLKEILNLIKNEKNNKILITHYLFFSALSEQNLFSPSKTYTLDGASFPIKGNKYYDEYKKFFNLNIEKNKIKKIYLIKTENLDQKTVEDYIDKNCYQYSENKYLKIYTITNKCFNN